ncbi:MAG TPA: hypothetical protein VGA42_02765 [Gemmatimonadales bacterium]
MRGSAITIGLILWASAATPLVAVGQIRRELGVHLIAASAPRATVVAGPSVAWRVGRRDRVVLQGGAGLEEEGVLAGRLEALWHFHLDPGALGKPGAYLGGGVGALVGDEWRGIVIVTLGLEGSPGARAGWIVELGVGGGVRLGLGYRWRWAAR